MADKAQAHHSKPLSLSNHTPLPLHQVAATQERVEHIFQLIVDYPAATIGLRTAALSAPPLAELMARPPTLPGPRLPHEVQVSVLAFALLTVDPQSRNRVRLNLRLVCKRWNQSVYDWKEVEAVELKQLRGLVKAIEEDEDRKESVRSVYLELMETGGKGKVASGVRLFELVERVTRVELRVGFKAFGGREEEETLSKKVRKVMVKWQRLKHFQIGGKVGAKLPAVSLTTLKE